MDKNKLNGFIDKYSLGGVVESVKWVSTTNNISTNFVSEDKTLLGSVKYDDSDLREGTYGIYTTSQLKRLLSVLNNDIEISVKNQDERNIAFHIKDQLMSIRLDYILSEESIIPKAPKLKQIPTFPIGIHLNDKFITQFIKAKNALPDESNFTIKSTFENIQVIVGHSNAMLTNKIKFNVSTDRDPIEEIDHISFSADHMKEILLANRDMTSGNMEISPEGLAKITITGKNFKSQYYLVQTQTT